MASRHEPIIYNSLVNTQISTTIILLQVDRHIVVSSYCWSDIIVYQYRNFNYYSTLYFNCTVERGLGVGV